MTAATYDATTESEPVTGQSEWALIWGRLRRKKLAMIALFVIVVLYLAGIFAPLIAPYSFNQTNLDRGLEGPNSTYWLGSDRLGRDVFSRTLYSLRTTVIVTTAVVLSGSLLLGNTLGLLAGYRGGWVDGVIMRAGEVFSSLPSLVMLILINATLGERVSGWVRWIEDNTIITGLVSTGIHSYLLVFVALSLFFWVGTARIIRAQVLALRERDFIAAAEASGASTRRVIGRHLLPNVSFLIILSISTTLGGIAGSEILLTWFGVGVQDPVPSFGRMLFDAGGASTLREHPHLLLVPGAVVTTLLFAFALFGDALNDAVRAR